MRSPVELLNGRLAAKVNESRLADYTTLEEVDIALALAADVSALTNDYVTKVMTEWRNKAASLILSSAE